MPKIDDISNAARRLHIAKQGKRIPEDLHEDVEKLLNFVRRRISVVNTTKDISEEIKRMMPMRTQINLRVSHINTLDELCSLSEDELTGIFKRAQVLNISYSIHLIRKELDKHGVAHNLGPDNEWVQ